MNNISYFILLIALTFLLSPVKAGVSIQTHPLSTDQDTIILKNGKILIVQSIQLNEKGIMYKQYDSSPYSFLSNKQLSAINYGNGKKDAFSDGKRAIREGVNAILTPKEIDCEQAQKDIKNYKPLGTFYLIFLITFFTSAVVGWIPIYLYIDRMPKDKDLKMPENADADYKDCYRSLAKKKRAKTAWNAFFLASLSGIAIIFLIALIW